jgi:mRNA interferase RelE/StbE
MPGPRSVRISRRAEKILEALDARTQDQLKTALRELSTSPLLGKKLKGELEGLRSYRLGTFRIVYRFTESAVEVVFLDHRKDVYR